MFRWKFAKRNNYLKAKENTPNHFVYILECDDGTFYTGYTVDLIKRVMEHKLKIGAKYTQRRNSKLVYFETHSTKKQALEREKQIKNAGRKYKQLLIRDFKITLNQFKEDLFEY